MLGTMYKINFYENNFLHADFFFILLLSFADFFINILLSEQFFSKHHGDQSIKMFKNPDIVSLYLDPKCLQRLSADDKSHWKELNILINYNNCFHIQKRTLNLDLIEPLCYIFVKSDLQGLILHFCCQHVKWRYSNQCISRFLGKIIVAKQ